ncbi:complement C1q tumor necrosis factor-related protein 4-like [Mya arenaria]|uniref:complement C1q tumor necrosis factor-related protein 4-like n=1 Tax=Mya arenaria TaxID=6604 RepID=UPI0022E95235|nr:complement C1q tumor necrosis factor-related protein 4-like [Mya arenaria]
MADMKLLWTYLAVGIFCVLIKAQQTQDIAFSARVSQHVKNLTDNQPIVFDTIRYQSGHYYNKATGVFYVPRNGTYVFYVNILSEYNNMIETQLVVNGQSLALMYSGAGHFHGAGSNMAIAHLTAGDNVWVRLHGHWSSDRSVHCCWSTFSGFHLSDDEIAFSGSLSQHQRNLSAHQRLVFDNVLVNTKSSYNRNSGVFFVPESGLYLLHSNILSEHHNYVETEIVSNGQPLAEIFSGSASFGSGGNLVIAELAAGDNVWVKVNADHSSDMAIHASWSTFSGFRLSNAEIAFSAKLTANLTHMAANQTIVFDKVVTNFGSGYDPSTGHFRAAATGVYLLYTNILSEADNFIETELLVDGQALLEVYSGAGQYAGSGSNLVLVMLNEGQDVWMHVHGHWSSDMTVHCCWSTFSGYLLFDAPQSAIVG